ncbi:MAG: winged helix-turn-helix transcriptional regulator [Woeseia sp.]
MRTEAIGDLILSCQVAQALKILGDRWSFLILRDVFLGKHRFEDFRRRIGAARGTLTSRLNSLVEAGILYKSPYQTAPTWYEYRLTGKGTDLYPLALTAWRWEHDWATDEDHYFPLKLVHRNCGNTMLPELLCEHCRGVVRIHDVRYAPGPGAHQAEAVPPRFQRRSKAKTSYPEGIDTKLFHLADVIGDRWTGLVIAALFFGLHRYDEFGAAIGIATNILADRLKLLVNAGVVTRRIYRRKPARHEYRLTDKGRDLYGHTLMMHQWAQQWIVDGRPSPLLLTHLPCERPLKAIVVCSECSEQLVPGSVVFRLGNEQQG